MRDLAAGKIMGTNQENPNWAADLLASIEAKRKASTKLAKSPNRTTGLLRVVSRHEWIDKVHRAAALHGISASSYVRRALSLHLAVDLDEDVRDILWLCPELNPPKYAQIGSVRKGNTHDDGAGIERWCPHPGCDGAHLR